MELDTFFETGCANLPILEEQYEKYLKAPESVDPSWRRLFLSMDVTRPQPISKVATHKASQPLEKEVSVVFQPTLEAQVQQDVRINNLIEAYRTYGHLMAKINPIATHPLEEPSELMIETHGFTKQDLTKIYPTFGIMEESTAPLLKIVNTLKGIYCGNVGVEYMGLQKPELEKWLQEKIEISGFKANLTIDQKQLILQQLNKSELFESFLHTKYVGQKRFSLEGGETLIPMLSFLIEKGAELGAEEVILGMAHRGRLNVLSNILNKSYTEIFSEFDENYIPDSFEGSGDVKYHKGFFAEVTTASRRSVRVDMSPNPSHLEAVDPVVEGMALAKQVMLKDEKKRDKVVPVLIHGDAALAGQGVIYETLQMYNLQGYGTGGTVHFVINNQIGFTTLPKDARSTRYCTDIARAFSAPVFHVNAEDPEGCVYATILAMEIRQKFDSDVFIDLNCYRKYGHNEGDEPAFTQPLEYQLIRKKKPIREIFRDELIQQGVLEKYMAETLETEFKNSLNQALKGYKTPEPIKAAPKSVPKNNENAATEIDTKVPFEILQEVSNRFCAVPDGFNINPKLANLMKERLSMTSAETGSKPVDWGMAEMLAYGTLLWEGISIRLSGQDCCRGTFSHRHAMWMDQTEENAYYPLKHLKSTQGRFDVFNSPLSEYAVLGFEFGYSIAWPEALVLWEAQFGDFCNGAQVMIDQFISTSEQKWSLKSGLTLLLPHGYEGQGPEHSSARMERFLSLAGHDNLRIVNPTTPAQFFHLLRKQALNPIKKPLIVFTPKGLLRHPLCVSSIPDFVNGHFEEIIDDPAKVDEPKKVILCSGRIYYDLIAARTKWSAYEMAIVRIEQLYPFQRDKLKGIIDNYSGFKEIYWVQDEPENMGAWDFLRPQLRGLLPPNREIKYIGRPRSASTAVGSHAVHKQEAAAILGALFKEYETHMPKHEIGIEG